MENDPSIASLQHAWLALSRQSRLPAVDERLRRDAGTDLARPALVALARLNDSGPMTISELAALSGVDVSTMSRTLKHLTASGLARRQRGGDLRCVLLEITPSGRETVDQMMAALRRMLLAVLQDWTETDRSDLARLMTRFSEDFARSAGRTTTPLAAVGALP